MRYLCSAATHQLYRAQVLAHILVYAAQPSTAFQQHGSDACRWEKPKGNILAVYFDSCSKHQASATSKLASLVTHRKHMMSPFPYHVLTGKTRDKQVHFVIKARDFERSGHLSVAEVKRVVAIVAPVLEGNELQQFFSQLAGTAEPATLPLAACADIVVWPCSLCSRL